jgi:branched-chain amino acid transport system substrate-binding protein
VKARAIVVALAALLAGSCTVPGTSNGNQNVHLPEIAIASDIPLNGALGLGARPLSDAVALAIHDQGTIGGYRLTYRPFDDSFIGDFNTDKAEQNVKLMINDSRVVALIGPFSSGAARVDVPLGNKTNLVIISPSNTLDCLNDGALHNKSDTRQQLLPHCSCGLRPVERNGPIRYARPGPHAFRGV